MIVRLSAAKAARLSLLVSQFYSQPGVQGQMQFSHARKNSVSCLVNNDSVIMSCPPNTHCGNPSWLAAPPANFPWEPPKNHIDELHA